MQVVKTFGHLVGGTLLVAGTSIGVGMLALPISTAAGGFVPSILLYFLCWLFMLCTGLLILEACIWMPKNANLITLSTKLLGKWGKTVCWILYLFLFSCLMIAHILGGGNVVSLLSGSSLGTVPSTILYVMVFAPVVYLGTIWVDRLNVILMLGIAITYLLFVVFSIRYVDLSMLTRIDWKHAWGALPVVFTAFGYQSLIPTLYNYMNRNIKKLRLALILGTSIPFCLYILWEVLILGIIPYEGAGGLADALKKGQNAVDPLGAYIHNATLLTVGEAFAFFAMTTSFLGISIAFVDFLADGLNIEKKSHHKFGICSALFVLFTIVTLLYPSVFLKALGLAGGLGVALLLGAMPVLMVWSGRYYHGHSLMHQQLPGGKITLSALLLFVVFELYFTFGG